MSKTLTLLAALLLVAESFGATADVTNYQPQAPVVRVTSTGRAIPYGIGAANAAARGSALEDAVGAASTGDVIVAYGPADLTISASLDLPSGTTLQGQGRPTIIANGLGAVAIVTDASDIVVRGLRIETDETGVGFASGSPVTASGLRVDDVEVVATDNGASGISYAQNAAGGGSGVAHTVEARITGCKLTGGSLTGYGVVASLSATGTIEVVGTSGSGGTDGFRVDGTTGTVSTVCGGDWESTLDAVTSGGTGNIVYAIGLRAVGGQTDILGDDGAVYESGCVFTIRGGTVYTVTAGETLSLVGEGHVTWPLNRGGTGATTAAAARSSLGVNVRTISLLVSAPTADAATGDGQVYVHVPASLNGGVITAVHAGVVTAGTTGTTDVQIARVRSGSPVDVLSTKLTIDSGETGSDTAAAAAVINASNDDLATNDRLRIDVDAVSTTAPKGLIVTIEVTK